MNNIFYMAFNSFYKEPVKKKSTYKGRKPFSSPNIRRAESRKLSLEEVRDVMFTITEDDLP